MDMDFSPEDIAFREEVRAFLRDNLPERLRDGARRTPGVFVEPDIGMEWHRILYEKGWVAPTGPRKMAAPAGRPRRNSSSKRNARWPGRLRSRSSACALSAR